MVWIAAYLNTIENVQPDMAVAVDHERFGNMGGFDIGIGVDKPCDRPIDTIAADSPFGLPASPVRPWTNSGYVELPGTGTIGAEFEAGTQKTSIF